MSAAGFPAIWYKTAASNLVSPIGPDNRWKLRRRTHPLCGSFQASESAEQVRVCPCCPSLLGPRTAAVMRSAFGGTGDITQVISVTAGHVYQVVYYLDASQPSVYDQFCVSIGITTEVSQEGPQNCSALFTGSTIDNDGTIDQGESSGYVKESFQFTATGTAIDLTFADYPCIVGVSVINQAFCAGITSDTPLYPFLLDDVSVTDITQQGGSSSTPEPGALITMLGGVAALALLKIQSRHRARAGSLAPGT